MPGAAFIATRRRRSKKSGKNESRRIHVMRAAAPPMLWLVPLAFTHQVSCAQFALPGS
jgi:hypothetical protein